MDNVNRRSFLKVVGVGLCGCVAASILAACDKDEEIAAPAIPSPDNYPTVNIADFPALAAVDGIVKTIIKDKNGKAVNSGNPLILYRVSDTKFVVLDTICTHRGVEVTVSGKTASCPAHGAQFSTVDGSLTEKGGSDGGIVLKPYKSTYDALKNTLTIQI